MRIQQAFLIISLAVSTVLVGCVGRVRYPTYYTLHVPPAPDPPAAAALRASLAIREFRSPVYLRQGPLVSRASAEQIGFYDHLRWPTDPPQFVPSAVAARPRASGTSPALAVYGG